VAQEGNKRDGPDALTKILKQNSNVQNRAASDEMAVTEFRVRCIQPLCHLSAERKAGRASRAVFSGAGASRQGRAGGVARGRERARIIGQ
jgi:hypothetical protein